MILRSRFNNSLHSYSSIGTGSNWIMYRPIDKDDGGQQAALMNALGQQQHNRPDSQHNGSYTQDVIDNIINSQQDTLQQKVWCPFSTFYFFWHIFESTCIIFRNEPAIFCFLCLFVCLKDQRSLNLHKNDLNLHNFLMNKYILNVKPAYCKSWT